MLDLSVVPQMVNKSRLLECLWDFHAIIPANIMTADKLPQDCLWWHCKHALHPANLRCIHDYILSYLLDSLTSEANDFWAKSTNEVFEQVHIGNEYLALFGYKYPSPLTMIKSVRRDEACHTCPYFCFRPHLWWRRSSPWRWWLFQTTKFVPKRS